MTIDIIILNITKKTMPEEFKNIATPQGGQEGETRQIVITSDDWLRGMRPEGYQQTSSVIKTAHRCGMRVTSFLGEAVLSKWNVLIHKAKTDGLTREESDEVAALSVKINQVLGEALNAGNPGT